MQQNVFMLMEKMIWYILTVNMVVDVIKTIVYLIMVNFPYLLWYTIFPLFIKEKNKNVYNDLDINNNHEKEKEVPLKYIIPESQDVPIIIKIINKEKGIKDKLVFLIKIIIKLYYI